jgi:hypothetical protein
MSKQASTLLAWSLCGLTIFLILCAATLAVLNRYNFGDASFLVAETSAAVVGGLISARQPRNPVGWLILGHALCFTLGEFGRQYAIYGVQTEPGSLPAAELAIWPTYWIWFPGIILMIVLLPLYFPSGHLLSPRWRWVVWGTVLCSAFTTGMAMLLPGDHEAPGIPNPFGLDSVPEWLRFFELVFATFAPASWMVFSAIAVASLVLRFRRSGGEERQQIKWVVYAMVSVALGFAGISLTQEIITLPPLLDALLFVGFLESLWISLAVAILRYRLYDIDVLINRTLVYGSLTVTLVALYFGVIVVLQRVLVVVTGQESTLAVVASTLLIAALFNPLRHSIQNFIDRRFYRRKYDAAKTLEEFGATLRAATDLDGLREELTGVVREAVQPAHISLWLAPARGKEGRG